MAPDTAAPQEPIEVKMPPGPTYPPVKCPDCGVWWRTPTHACIGVKP